MIEKLLSRVDSRIPLRLLCIIVFMGLIALGNLFGLYTSLQTGDPYSISTSVVAVALYLIPAYGLLKLQNWGRILAMAVCVVGLCSGLIIVRFDNWIIGAIALIFHGSILIYLKGPVCQELFRAARAAKRQ